MAEGVDDGRIHVAVLALASSMWLHNFKPRTPPSFLPAGSPDVVFTVREYYAHNVHIFRMKNPLLHTRDSNPQPYDWKSRALGQYATNPLKYSIIQHPKPFNTLVGVQRESVALVGIENVGMRRLLQMF